MSNLNFNLAANHGEEDEANWYEAAKSREEMHQKLDALINKGYTSILVVKF